MTVSRRELMAAAGASTVPNSRWDELNPLYCANQSIVYANVNLGATSANLYSADAPAMCIGANSTVHDYILCISTQSSGANNAYYPMIRANFTTNTISVINNSAYYSHGPYTRTPIGVSFSGSWGSETPYSIVLDSGLILTCGYWSASSPPSSTYQYATIQAVRANTDAAAYTWGSIVSLTVSTNSTSGSTLSSLARINSTAAVWKYQANTAPTTNTKTVLQVVTVDPTTLNLNLGASAILSLGASNTSAESSSVNMANTTRGFVTASNSTATVCYPFTIQPNNSIVVGSPTTSAISVESSTLLYSNGNNYYYLRDSTATNIATSFSYNPTTNTISNVNSATLPKAIFYTNRRNGIVSPTISNNAPAYVALMGDYTFFVEGTSDGMVTKTVAINATPSACVPSDFSIHEIQGRNSTGNYTYPSPVAGGLFPLANTTRGLWLTASTTGGAPTTNVVSVVYRFLDANASSQTVTYNIPGANSYTAPRAGQLFIQCYGAGGSSNVQSNATGGFGPGTNTHAGGGGGFSYKTINVTAGQVIALNIGSPTSKTNTTANTIVCTPGANATKTASGAGGSASGGDLNANGASGTSGTIVNQAEIKGTFYGSSDVSGNCGSPGPVKTGYGYTTSTQVYGNYTGDHGNSTIGTGGTFLVTNTETGTTGTGRPGGNGAIIIGIK